MVGLLWHEAPPGPARTDGAAPAPVVPPAVVREAPAAAKAQQQATAPHAAQPPALDAAGPAAVADARRAVAAEGSASPAPPPPLSRRAAPMRAPVLVQEPAAPPAEAIPPWADAVGQATGGANGQAGDAAAAWLRELARQTSGPWRDAVDKAPPAEAADFVLSRGGATAGRL